MEIITKTIPVVLSLQQVLEIADHQVTAQELLNERLYIKGQGWGEISLAPEFRVQIAENIAERLGGRQATKNAQMNNLE